MRTEAFEPRTLDPSLSSGDAVATTIASADPAVALLTLMVASRGVQGDLARNDVEHQSKLIDEMRARIQDALERAEEAQNDAGFWGDIANVLGGDVAAIFGVIAAAALVVATGGSGAPAILALVAAGMSVGADVGERLGLDPKICAGLSAGGALVGVLGGNVSGAAGVWGTVAKVGNVSQAVASAGSGGATMASGAYQGDALDAQADAKHATGLQNDAWLRLEMALEVLRGVTRDIERSKHTVSSIETDKHAGRAAIIAGLGAA